MIAPELEQELRPFFSGRVPWDDIRLTFQSLQGMSMYQPAALAPRAMQALTLKGAARALQTAGVTIKRHVILDPNFGKLDTAAGMALLGHEILHVQQGETIPNFEELYDQAAQQTDPDRPWENPYEAPAYALECRIWHSLVAQGWPPGAWKPMGVTLGLCSGA